MKVKNTKIRISGFVKEGQTSTHTLAYALAITQTEGLSQALKNGLGRLLKQAQLLEGEGVTSVTVVVSPLMKLKFATTRTLEYGVQVTWGKSPGRTYVSTSQPQKGRTVASAIEALEGSGQ